MREADLQALVHAGDLCGRQALSSVLSLLARITRLDQSLTDG